MRLRGSVRAVDPVPGRRRPGRTAQCPARGADLDRGARRHRSPARTTIIVPVGGTEQSGPHIALGKHNVRARVLAGRIAAALGDTLVAPVARLRAGRRDLAAGRAHALPRHDLDPGRGVQERCSRRPAAASGRRLSPYRADRRPRRLPVDPEAGGGRAEQGVGGHAACGLHFIADYYRGRRRAYVRPCAQGPERRADRQPCRRGRHVADAGDRSRAGALRSSGAAVTARPTARTATRAASSAALGQLGVDLDRVADCRRDSQGHRARRRSVRPA